MGAAFRPTGTGTTRAGSCTRREGTAKACRGSIITRARSGLDATRRSIVARARLNLDAASRASTGSGCCRRDGPKGCGCSTSTRSSVNLDATRVAGERIGGCPQSCSRCRAGAGGE